ncbi:hypothetical protein [Clostridium niameyense]|nr:hypothetical protein [Clostridium niameyense]
MDINKVEAKERVRKMLIDGDSFEKVRRETNLREKDIKRIYHDISKHF